MLQQHQQRRAPLSAVGFAGSSTTTSVGTGMPSRFSVFIGSIAALAVFSLLASLFSNRMLSDYRILATPDTSSIAGGAATAGFSPPDAGSSGGSGQYTREHNTSSTSSGSSPGNHDQKQPADVQKSSDGSAGAGEENNGEEPRSSDGSVDASEVNGGEDLDPKVVWLMSFPNSGTSYTITNTEITSQKSVATNYQQEVLDQNEIVPLLSSSPSPYLLDASMDVPNLVLTKTHCIGYCDVCVPMTNSEEFEMGCRSLKTTDDAETGEKGHRDYYSARKLVTKAVHLFRNPFDNLVARMHHGIKRRSRNTKWKTKKRLQKKLAKFQESTNGLREWCKYLDTIFRGDFDEIMWDMGVDKQLYEHLPCRTEWFRYVQWHNAAIEVLDRLHVPVYVLYYEDYTAKYNDTVRDLFRFLELDAVHPNAHFLPGKTYDHMYNDNVHKLATEYVKAIASPACFKHIKHYFEPWLDGEDKVEDFTATALASTSNGKDDAPKVAWLLSYPNSGTSYTMLNTKIVTNRTTATNSGQEVSSRVPLRSDSGAPFIRFPEMMLPNNLVVLTKAHCTGFCFGCEPATDAGAFEKSCRTASWSSPSGLKKTVYEADVVEKAVHIIRNPYDNIVSRMHHGLSHQEKLGYSDKELESMERDTPERFQAWCKLIDKRFASLVPESVAGRDDAARLLAVPCHADFIRYVEWHNKAVETLNQLEIPVYNLYYENYDINFNATVAKLYDFLGHPMVGTPFPFESGKTYLDKFTTNHMREVAYLVRSLASDDVWTLIRHYFLDWVVGSDDSVSNEQRKLPEVAWLLSFPNSGTSYTMMNIQRMSETSGASNYGKEILDDRVVRVRSDVTNSPFLLHPEREVPHVVITKTHCTGYCDTCPNINGVHTAESFQLGCQSGSLLPGEEHHYPSSIVKKAIHLFRHPLDNLVARKHLGIENRLKRHPEVWGKLAMANNTKAGFRQWCRYIDKQFQSHRSGLSLLDNETRALFAGVPCASELWRYTQWHNLAMETTKNLQLPVHYLSYEDYSSNFNETVQGLADFLGLKLVQPPMEFVQGLSYSEYFDAKDAKIMAEFVRTFASEDCWQSLRRYFGSWVGDNNSAEKVLPESNEANFRQIAWLLSFPNSGTTFTVDNVERISNTSTGVNYAKEVLPNIEKVLPFLEHSPYVHNVSLRVPPTVLTKSHCGGYCDSCNLKESSLTLATFEIRCGEDVMGSGGYASSIPRKIVHLIRNPFDNIVSRMHHGVIRRKQFLGWTDEQLAPFNDTRQGFLSWCKYVDKDFWRRDGGQARKLNIEVPSLAKEIPCHSDFYRYSQWHNHVVGLSEKLKIPTHVLFYEDYATNFNKTVSDLFEFLDLPIVNGPSVFVPGKTYGSFFSASERLAVRQYVKNISSPQSWDLLRRYFGDPFLSEDGGVVLLENDV